MKKLILLLACFTMLAISHANAQYKVTKVSGRVKTSAGIYIRPGLDLNPADQVVFSTQKDKIWIIVPGQGEKIVTPSAAAQSTPEGFAQALSDATFSDISAVSLRAGVAIIENIPDAITPADEKTGKILIEQENKFLFSQSTYPQSNGSTFFLEIRAMSQKTITRRLHTNGDTLIVSYNDFLTESADPSKSYILGYYNANGNTSSRVGVINPYFDLTNEMEDIILNTVSSYKNQNMPEDSLRLKAYNNVYSFSAKPNGILFSSLFEKYWQGNFADTMTEGRHRRRGNNFQETDFLAVPVLSESATASRDELPTSCSLRQFAPPVGDQGDFNTCSAWASAYATRTIAFAVSHNYTVNNNYDKIIKSTFSPDFVYNNVQPSGDCNQTSSLKRSLMFIADKGALLKTSSNFACGVSYVGNDFDSAKNYRIKDFQRINNPATDSEMGLTFKIKTLLVNKNAIAFGMETPDSFDDVKKSGVWNPTPGEYKYIDSVRSNLLKRQHGHAMCVIGYNDDINGGSFEIMNSWGPTNGNNGFYWINYHDFFLFAYEMYTVSDYGADSATAATNTNISAPAKADSTSGKTAVAAVQSAPVAMPAVPSISPVPATTQPTAAATNVVVEDTRPRIKGQMELMLQQPDKSYESVNVTENMVDSNGLQADINTVAPSAGDVAGYASFNLAKPLYSGNRYQIKFSLVQPAYIYVISKDDNNNYSRLFPQQARNESPLINFTNATLYLPNQKQNYKLDNVPGKEKMCVLLSKSPIDINTLDQQVSAAGTNIYKTLRASLAGRLLEIKNIKYANDARISFDSQVSDNNVLAFFIEMNHL